MAQAQKTVSRVKTSAAKAAPKAAPKAATKPVEKAAQKTVFSAVALVVAYIDSIRGAVMDDKAKETFYASAVSHHTKKGTKFPRPAYVARANELAAAKEGDANHKAILEVFRQHKARILANGSADSRAVFDLYMANRKAK